LSKIRRTSSMSELYFSCVVNIYSQIIDCVQSVNLQSGEELAVCSIAIKTIGRSLLNQIGEDKTGKLDNSLFEIDSYKFIVSHSQIMRIASDETVGKAVTQIDELDYIVDIHAHYNERKGVWGYLKVHIYLPQISTDNQSDMI